MTRIALVDAFTTTAGDGNRAGVVIDEALDARAMQAIAKAVGASETAFVGEGRCLRYFTPTTEIPFCGHATLASCHLMAERGLVPVPGQFELRCPAGSIDVEIERRDRIWFSTPLPPVRESPIGEGIWPLLGGDASQRDSSLPLLLVGTKLFVPLSRRADLFALAPRWDEVAALASDGILGVLAFTRDAIEPQHVAHSRFFAPACGIREDPVTGSANGPLARYLAEHGVIALPAAGGTVRARAEQGDAIGKPGRIELEVSGAPGRIDRVRIGGAAITVLTGTLS